PHSRQNLACKRLSCWQRGHCMPALRSWTCDGRNGGPRIAAQFRMVKDAGEWCRRVASNGAMRLCGEAPARYHARSRAGRVDRVRTWRGVSERCQRLLMREVGARSDAHIGDSRTRQRVDQGPQVWRKSFAPVAECLHVPVIEGPQQRSQSFATVAE